MLHPVYDDEQEVRRLTQQHVEAGRTVLQMFQLGDTERVHSLRVFKQLRTIPVCGSVLSLGCGVAGMEAYWQERRPDLGFELVNRSEAQLDLCVCPGRKVCGDAQHYVGFGGFDVVVVAYVLGHVVPELVLKSARANCRKAGQVMVLDVFEGTEEFNQYFHYDTVTKKEMRGMGFVEVEQPHPWRLMPLIHQQAPWVPRHVTPGMWVRDV